MSGSKQELSIQSAFLPEDAVIKVIGLGGVGGVVVRYLTLFLASLMLPVRLVLVDGDTFEPSNTGRMYFSRPGNKAAVMRDDLLEYCGDSELLLVAIEEYVTPENLDRLLNERDLIILAVDNHPTRKMVSDFCATRLRDVCLISGGNDGVGTDSSGRALRGTFGNCQIFVRKNGVSLSPSLTQYHPEIREPAGHLPTEMGCGELMASVPQILFTNVTAAATILNTFWLYTCGSLRYQEITFDIAQGVMSPMVLPTPTKGV